MAHDGNDAISPWFRDAEELGEFIGIRFGRLAPGETEPEWTYMRHAEFDGIGGLAEILRRRGAELNRLMQIKYPLASSWTPFIKALPKYLKKRRRLKWLPLERGPIVMDVAQSPPLAIAWHVFDETTTTHIRRVCRKAGVTVNSFLVKHLTKAIRPFLEDQSSVVPWMIPVNLRGKVLRENDTTNYSSYIGVKVSSYETLQDVHRNIYAALGRREHWANWHSYQLSRILTSRMRKALITRGLAISEWFLGGFSNLGDWDPDKQIRMPACQGAWLFSPPVLRVQLVGAGCVTFQNRLSLTIQAHPDLTNSSSVPRAWIGNWVKEIEMDLNSLLEESIAVSHCAA